MAGGRRSGADRVLESRHLVGLFLGVVLLCGVFFTLGYVMGKTQYGGSVHAAESITKASTPARASSSSASRDSTSGSDGNSSPDAGAAAPANSAPAASEWDFYTQKKSEHLEATPKSAPPASIVARPEDAATKPVPTAARFQAPRLIKGSIVLQIAALTRQGDALAMADELQAKHFPSFVVAPASDNFYRVQVGPYSDEHAADTAKAALDQAGFKAIIKR
jgi:DedD protein